MKSPLVHIESESEVTQLCPTLCDPTDFSLPGFSVHGIFWTTVLEWVAISFSRGSSRPRDRTWVSYIIGRCFYRLNQGRPYNLYRLDGVKKQCNLLCSPGTYTESKGGESTFRYVPVCLHFDCGGQFSNYSHCNCQ